MWRHAIVGLILSWIVAGDLRAWWLALSIGAIHLFIDMLKSFLQRKQSIYTFNQEGLLVDGPKKQNGLYFFLVDQTAHLLSIVLLGLLWFHCCSDRTQFAWLSQLATAHPLRVNTIIALLLALKPANVFILLVLEACKVKDIPQILTLQDTSIHPLQHSPVNSDHSATSQDMSVQRTVVEVSHISFHSGELIGWLERGLIVIFVVLSQYEAIGFLIAAKSILRFGETSKGNEKSEYVLTGTLLSLTVALCPGVLAAIVRWS